MAAAGRNAIDIKPAMDAAPAAAERPEAAIKVPKRALTPEVENIHENKLWPKQFISRL